MTRIASHVALMLIVLASTPVALHESIPVLSRALESDHLTHCLALEQISVTARKFFTWFPTSRSHADQEKMTIRVRYWVKVRGYLK